LTNVYNKGEDDRIKNKIKENKNTFPANYQNIMTATNGIQTDYIYNFSSNDQSRREKQYFYPYYTSDNVINRFCLQNYLNYENSIENIGAKFNEFKINNSKTITRSGSDSYIINRNRQAPYKLIENTSATQSDLNFNNNNNNNEYNGGYNYHNNFQEGFNNNDNIPNLNTSDNYSNQRCTDQKSNFNNNLSSSGELDERSQLYNFVKNLSEELHDFICSQKGSREMQKFLNKITSENLNFLINKIGFNIYKMMTNVYANYFCQKLFQSCSSEQRLKILKYVKIILVIITI